MAWKQSDSSIAERRHSPRHPAAGLVWLWPSGQTGPAQPVEGQLLDRSDSGFRVAYASGELETGQQVEFAIGHQQGLARVAWNRFTRQHWESGLMIL